ncbi:hypothetical protein HK104_002371 [Borealophlyctis nickersoniae]|nr:hypothetical protein HK104_002371 [Borealophlyctis nickersoniae]
MRVSNPLIRQSYRHPMRTLMTTSTKPTPLFQPTLMQVSPRTPPVPNRAGTPPRLDCCTRTPFATDSRVSCVDNEITERNWWKEVTVYEVYVKSFKDSNADGRGDLKGIIEKLDYLKALGVDVIWLTPVYQSPMHDEGYDISDYKAINPEFGTMEDWDNLLAGIHKRGMKLIMDLVVNHTSHEHPWFVESRASKDNPKRSWYFWRPPKIGADGKMMEPNNWESVFGGSAWTYDPVTGEYYLHLFSPFQPDLNWDNPEVRNAVHDIMTFWLDKGIDGFRMDVINMISKDPGLPDAPIVNEGEPWQPGSQFFINGPNVHRYLREMNERVLSRYDIMTVGEMPGAVDPQEALKYVASDRKELNMVFHFEIMDIDSLPGEKWIHKPWTLTELKRIVAKWQFTLRRNDGWNSLYLENHDQPRSVSRFASDTSTERTHAAKMLATFMCLLRGTMFLYQGQELGMKNLPPENLEIGVFRDIETLRFWESVLQKRRADNKVKIHRIGPLGGIDPVDEVDMSDVLSSLAKKSRDNARTPMHWSPSPNAGFTLPSVDPWIPVNPDYTDCNVETQSPDPSSVLTYWKKLLAYRKQNILMIYGNLRLLDEGNEEVYAAERTCGRNSMFVVIHWRGGSGVKEWEVPEDVRGRVKLIIGNYVDGEGEDEDRRKVEGEWENGKVVLRSWEARLYVPCSA